MSSPWRNVMRRYVRPHWRCMSVSSLALVVSTGASIYFPHVLGQFIDDCRRQSSNGNVENDDENHHLLVVNENVDRGKVMTSENGANRNCRSNNNKDEEKDNQKVLFWRHLGTMSCIFGVVGLATYVRTANMQHVAQSIGRQLRRDAYRCLLVEKPIHLFSASSTTATTTGGATIHQSSYNGARLAHQLTNHVELLTDFISKNSMTGVRALGEGLGGLAFLYTLSSQLTSTVFLQVWLPMTLVIGYLYSKRVKHLNQRYLSSMSSQSSFASERLSAMKSMVCAFGQNKNEITRYETRYLSPLLSLGVKLGISNAIFEGLLYTGTHLSILGMIWMGAMSILDVSSHFSLGDLSSMLLYSVYVVQSYGTLSSIFSKFQQCNSAMHQINQLLVCDDSNNNGNDNGKCSTRGDESITTLRVVPQSGHIEFQNVCFSYPERPGITVLNQFSASIPHGQVVMVVGPSGSSKSTLSLLLTRFYNVSSGSIRLDGYDVRAINATELRSEYIAVVPQHASLFHCSILDNIVYGTGGSEGDDADDVIDFELVERLCRMVGIHDFIVSRLPMGYDTILGDQSTQLSGGQKQRLNICRTLYFYHKRNTRVYILDECTSNLDVHAEEAVLTRVIDYVRNEKRATCLVITHKPHHLQQLVSIDQTIVLGSSPSSAIQPQKNTT